MSAVQPGLGHRSGTRHGTTVRSVLVTQTLICTKCRYRTKARLSDCPSCGRGMGAEGALLSPQAVAVAGLVGLVMALGMLALLRLVPVG